MPDDGNRFDTVADSLHELHQAATALEAAKAGFAAAQDRVCEQIEVLRPADRIGEPPDPQLLALVRQLYWTQPDVPSDRLAAAAGFRWANGLTQAIGPTTSGVACVECGHDISRTSRSWTPKTRGHNGPPICLDCYKTGNHEREAASKLSYARRSYAATGSVPAPAWEWIVAVELLRAYPPVSTGIEPGSEMDRVTGTWREYDSSIYVGRIVDRLHGEPEHTVAVPQVPARVLLTAAANVAAWDSTRACEIVETFTDEAPTYVLARLLARVENFAAERAEKALELFPDGSQSESRDYEDMWGDRWRYEVRAAKDAR